MSSQGAGAIEIVAVNTPRQLSRFIRLPIDLHRGRGKWVAPLVLERQDVLSRKKNPYFRHAEMELFLALRDGRPVGRISAQIDRNFLAKWGEGIGHFGFIDGIDDATVFAALLDAAEGWLRQRGMRHVYGPFSPTINDEPGILVEGFDTPPMMMMAHAEPYHATHLAAAGYGKARDLFAYSYDTRREPSETVRRLVAKAESPRIVIRPMGKASYAREVREVLEIFNEAWSDNWCSVALTEEEMEHLGKSMRPIVDRRLVWFAEVDGRVAGMVVVLPNVNEAIADLDGSLLPFGWAKLLWRLKVRGLKSARVPLMGIRREFAKMNVVGAALPFLLIDAMRRAAISAGYERAELSWILEDNLPVRRVIEAFGGVPYKTYRIFEKAIA
ncbi:MAG: dATP pyrophosphohydrolase [Alphaproteobacteria bacterium]|nr:dATP pyrophosphohydrolase [Alphaproteobacteria bacterium]